MKRLLAGGLEGKGAVVQDDAKRAVGSALIGEGFVDHDFVAFAVTDPHVALPEGDVAAGAEGGCLEADGGPGFEGESGIIREGGVAAGEVGEGALGGGAEGLGAVGEGGFEEDGAGIVGVETADGLAGYGAGIGAVGSGAANGDESLAPGLLGGGDVVRGDGRGGCRSGRGGCRRRGRRLAGGEGDQSGGGEGAERKAGGFHEAQRSDEAGGRKGKSVRGRGRGCRAAFSFGGDWCPVVGSHAAGSSSNHPEKRIESGAVVCLAAAGEKGGDVSFLRILPGGG